ncbi:MAG: SpoIID/LytB domain-containing protein [Bradymonadia bacterium]
MKALYISLIAIAWCACSPNESERTEVLKSRSASLVQRVIQVDGVVRHAVTLEPVSGVDVRVAGSAIATSTDEMGRYRLTLRGVERRIELNKVDYLRMSTTAGRDALLWPMAVSDEQANTVLERRRQREMDSDPLNDPDLRPEAAALIRATREGHTRSGLNGTPGRLKMRPVPPETIRIYRRGPENNSCTGRVDVIPLEEYVKGVVPHEWIPSWHEESLRAGGIVARSYAWGWINAGGKYDCADLDDTTRSQVYREERVQRVSQAIDTTRGVAVIRDGQVVRSEYSAENGDPTAFGVDEPLCTGRELFGHGRGLCQWGSQRWATQRSETAEWMIGHYYPGANVSSDQPVADPVGIRVELAQRLERLDPVSCPSPETMYDCADFLDQSFSAGIFDLYETHQAALTYEVTNTGDIVVDELSLRLDIPERYVALDGVEGALLTRAQANGFHTVTLQAPLEPGQTASVRLLLGGRETSIPSGRSVSIRGWISRLDDVYLRPDWSTPAAINDEQRFDADELLKLTEVDIVSGRRWTWQSGQPGMFEGWTTADSTIELAEMGGLLIGVNGGSARIDSPWLPTLAAPIQSLRLTQSTNAVLRLWWRRAESPFIAANSMIVPADTEWLATPGLPNDIVQIRLETQDAVHIETLALLAENVGQEADADVRPIRDEGLGPDDQNVGWLDRDAYFEPDAASGAPILGSGASYAQGQASCRTSSQHWGDLLIVSLLALPLFLRSRRRY